MNAYNGKELESKLLKVQWGKNVSLPDRPCYTPDELKSRITPPAVTESRPFNAIASPADPHNFAESCVKVVQPEEKQVRLLIHRTIEFVLKYGAKFKKQLATKEARNPAFQFLTDYQSNEHIYYRWRLWSLSHGETVTRWSEEPYKIIKG